MAEGAVNLVLGRIESFVVGEWKLEKSVKTGVDSLRLELENMKAVARDADARGEDNNVVGNWVKQVRDVGFAIDYVLNMFEFRLAQRQQENLLQSQVSGFKARHSIANLIQEINNKLEIVRQVKLSYISMGTSSSSSSSNITTRNGTISSRMASLYAEDAEIVGIEEPKTKLISWALEECQTQKVIFVVAMDGSGKTAVVGKVYENMKEKFDCHAWITVSRYKNKLEILWNMLNRLHNLTGAADAELPAIHLNEVDLVDKIRNHLQDKRYVIVLHDLCNKDVWESIRFALPKSTTASSRIIITTRRGDIASSCSDSCIEVHNLEPLCPDKAQELLHKIAFRQSGGICPSGLVKWSWMILNICEGLPLAIIEIGRFLSNREKTEYEWKRLLDGLESELMRRDGALSNITTTLLMSYNELPYYLKYCFLYMSNFPEGCAVKCRRLIRLWMGEGFLRRETGKEPEDVGEECLKELIGRCLIKVIKWDFDGKPRSCRAHHLMHKIILSKARDEKFCTVYNETDRNVTSEMTRRLSIQKSDFNMSQENFSSASTLFMFEAKTQVNIPSSLNLLRVLHLEGARLDKFISPISNLLLVRYLCLSNTQITVIPESVGNLCCLETLDLKQTLVRKLPKEIANIITLRHLLVCKYNIGSYVTFDCVEGFEFEASTKIKKLINLLKLSFVKANGNHSLIRGLRYLSQLQKLGIIDLQEEDGPILCNTIQMLRNLLSLNVTSLRKEQYLHLQAIDNPPPLLQRLYLKGLLKSMPIWISRLNDLVRIRLKWSRLAPKNNPIAILEDLPNLLELQLLDAYTGNQLDFNAGKFQRLKILELEKLEQLRMVVLETGTLPCLQKFIIKRCGYLLQVPVGIDTLTHLEQLHLYDMPLNFVSSLERNTGQLRHLVNHIPQIHSYYLHSEEYWVTEDLS